MITIVQVSQWLNTPTTGAWYSWLVGHAQSCSIVLNHAQSTQFQKFAWWSPSMINPRFLAGNTWKHILGCFNPILVIVYGIASQFLISSIHFVRLRNRLFCGHWYPFGCLQTPGLGIEKRTCLILDAKKNKNSSHHLDWIITLLAYHKDP